MRFSTSAILFVSLFGSQIAFAAPQASSIDDTNETISGVDSAGFGSAFQPEGTFVGTTSTGAGSAFVGDGVIQDPPVSSGTSSDSSAPAGDTDTSTATGGADNVSTSSSSSSASGSTPSGSGGHFKGAASTVHANMFGLALAGVVMTAIL